MRVVGAVFGVHGKRKATFRHKYDDSKREELYTMWQLWTTWTGDRKREDKAGLAYAFIPETKCVNFSPRELIGTYPDRLVIRELQGLLSSA